MKVILVFGARPNYMKIAPLYRALTQAGEWEPLLVNTGQHFDREMSEVFIEQLGLPAPDVHLKVGRGTQAQQIARVIERIEPVLVEHDPAVIIVVGDVSSTLAASISAATLQIPVAHVEAGLRSHDWTMPEERNRVLTDRLSRFLFTPSPDADQNLIDERIDPARIHCVGNVMIDTLDAVRDRLDGESVRLRLNVPAEFVLVTLHRPSNVDDPTRLEEILRALKTIADDMDVVFPMHPRTTKRLREFGLDADHERVHILKPLGYVEFASLMSIAKVIISDSGGIQEEAVVLGVPCLTLRENTERPITLKYGHNRLVKSEYEEILREFSVAISLPRLDGCRPPLWDGRTAERVVQILCAAFETRERTLPTISVTRMSHPEVQVLKKSTSPNGSA